MTYYKFHGVPITHEKQTFEFHPTNNLLAISKKKKFIEISETNLKMYCRYFNAREIWGCPALRILSKNYNKTASLMANGCKAAVVLVGNVVESLVAKNEDKDAIREGWTDGIKAMPDLAHSFGKNLGVAFQLVDDWLDFTQGVQQLGKPAAADLR